MNEAAAIALICAALGGEEEVTHTFPLSEGTSAIRVDCETDFYVIEVGLDKRSSLDSVQQAVFASILTGKDPMVIIVNTDGLYGTFEHRITTVANYLRVHNAVIELPE